MARWMAWVFSVFPSGCAPKSRMLWASLSGAADPTPAADSPMATDEAARKSLLSICNTPGEFNLPARNLEREFLFSTRIAAIVSFPGQIARPKQPFAPEGHCLWWKRRELRVHAPDRWQLPAEGHLKRTRLDTLSRKQIQKGRFG